jgi:hypothetical protein
MPLTSAGSRLPRSMPGRSRVAPVLASAREPALAQVRELALMAAQEQVPARELVAVRVLEPPLVGSMASLALTSRRRRTLPRAARTPQAEELT